MSHDPLHAPDRPIDDEDVPAEEHIDQAQLVDQLDDDPDAVDNYTSGSGDT